MKFALNWSPEASDLLKTKQIQVDLFKCPDWENLVPLIQAILLSKDFPDFTF